MNLPSVLAFGIPGGWEWILILVVVLVLFGNRIPGVARSLGSGITEFKKGLHEGEGDKAAGEKAAGEKAAGGKGDGGDDTGADTPR